MLDFQPELTDKSIIQPSSDVVRQQVETKIYEMCNGGSH